MQDDSTLRIFPRHWGGTGSSMRKPKDVQTRRFWSELEILSVQLIACGPRRAAGQAYLSAVRLWAFDMCWAQCFRVQPIRTPVDL